MTITIDAMRACCAKANELTTKFAWMATPVRLDGFIAATDKRAVLASYVLEADLPACPEEGGKVLLKYIQPAVAAAERWPTSRLADVKTWCGDYDPWIECPQCGGTGGSECESCGQDVNCWMCNNTGGKGNECRPGRIADIILDRNLLAKWMACISGFGTVRIGQAKAGADKPIAFVAPGEWALIVTPLTHPDNRPVADYPVAVEAV